MTSVSTAITGGSADVIKNPHNPILSLAVMGGALATIQVYSAIAPKLSDMRDYEPGDVNGRQQLLDADIIVGVTVAIAGGFASWGVNSLVPIFVLLLVFAFVSLWYHAVLNGVTHRIGHHDS